MTDDGFKETKHTPKKSWMKGLLIKVLLSYCVFVTISHTYEALVAKLDSMSEVASVSTFRANHRILSSAVSLYIMENDGEYPKNKEDLAKYIEIANLDDKPDRAKYILVDMDSYCAVVSIYDENVLFEVFIESK